MDLVYFAAYFSYLDNIEQLDDAERGRLFTACLLYGMTGEVPDLQGNERFVFPSIRSQMDRDAGKYERFCEKQTENGKLGGRPKKTPIPLENPNNPTVSLETQKSPENENENENDIEKEKNSVSPSIIPPKNKYGQYRWVQLTDDEYSRLIADLGEDEAKRAIAYVDECAQLTGNKNKWKDWNLVVRRAVRGGWGKENDERKPPHRCSLKQNFPTRTYTEDEFKNIGNDLLKEA